MAEPSEPFRVEVGSLRVYGETTYVQDPNFNSHLNFEIVKRIGVFECHKQLNPNSIIADTTTKPIEDPNAQPFVKLNKDFKNVKGKDLNVGYTPV